MAKYKSVLLVDDNDVDNMIHSEVIEDAEFATRIYVKVDGAEALQFMEESIPDQEGYFPPSIIFLDINMPRMNGFEFLDAYRTLPKEKKSTTIVIMLTTSLHSEDLARVEASGIVSTYIEKPLTTEHLARL